MKGSRHLTVVIKLGTSSIVHEKTHQPLLSNLSLIVETATRLRRDGHRVIIVSSGAIGVALQMVNLEKRPKHLPRVQALAALGQCRLMSLWDSLFAHVRQPVAQILLTRNDIADRTQYLNAVNTFSELLHMGIIPIVNENDTLSVAEIKFGDNDTLSAITAAMVSADYLFLMTDVDCLYTTNPRIDPDAKPIEVVSDISALAADVSSAGSSLGTGGMATKITAARLATSAGVTTVITRSSKPGNVADIVESLEALRTITESGSPSSKVEVPLPPLHTRFLPSLSPIKDRAFWLLHGLAPHGTIYIDEGAYTALRNGAGLLPVGVVDVEGAFGQQEAVRLVVVKRLHPLPGSGTRTPHRRNASSASNIATVITPAITPPPTRNRGSIAAYESGASTPSTPDPIAAFCAGETLPPEATNSTWSLSDRFERVEPAPREVGRALTNYGASEIARIMGLQSSDISAVLGYADSEYVALRENVSMFAKEVERDKEKGRRGSEIDKEREMDKEREAEKEKELEIEKEREEEREKDRERDLKKDKAAEIREAVGKMEVKADENLSPESESPGSGEPSPGDEVPKKVQAEEAEKKDEPQTVEHGRLNSTEEVNEKKDATAGSEMTEKLQEKLPEAVKPKLGDLASFA